MSYFDDKSVLGTLESEACVGCCGVVGKPELDFEATPSCIEWHLSHRCEALCDPFHQIGGCRRTLRPAEGIEQRYQFRRPKDGRTFPLVQDDDSRSAAQLDT